MADPFGYLRDRRVAEEQEELRREEAEERRQAQEEEQRQKREQRRPEWLKAVAQIEDMVLRVLGELRDAAFPESEVSVADPIGPTWAIRHDGWYDYDVGDGGGRREYRTTYCDVSARLTSDDQGHPAHFVVTCGRGSVQSGLAEQQLVEALWALHQ